MCFLPAIQLSNSVSGIPRVLKLYKGKAWGVPGHPNAAQGTIIPEGSLQLRFVPIIAKIPNIDFTVQRAVAMHDGIWNISMRKEET